MGIGKVKKAVVMYNAKGKSRGVALVTFANAASATKAVKEYHQAEVDGRPMYVKAVSYNTRPSTPKKKKTTKKRAQQKRRKKLPRKKLVKKARKVVKKEVRKVEKNPRKKEPRKSLKQ